MNENNILVFLSRPNPFIDNQKLFLNKFKEMLEAFDLEPVDTKLKI